jgi:hypothetical protein
MTKESKPHDDVLAHGMDRRHFLKLAAAAALLSGCKATAPTTAPTTVPPPAEDFSQVAYCGIRCQEACPEHAYPTLCDGCKSEGGKLGSYCERCAIRACASESVVITCAHCDEYATCEAEEWNKFPMLRRQIEEIRQELEGQA